MLDVGYGIDEGSEKLWENNISFYIDGSSLWPQRLMQCCHNLVIITANFGYSTIHQTRMLLDAVRLLSSMVKFRGSFSNFSVSLAHQVSCAHCLFYTLPSLTRGLTVSQAWPNIQAYEHSLWADVIWEEKIHVVEGGYQICKMSMILLHLRHI